MLIILTDRWQVLSYLIRVPLLNQANHATWQKSWLKDDKAPEKPIETTAQSSFTSSLASRASFLGREAAKRETKSREVPRHIKIGRSTVLKVYLVGKKLQEKL